jgi:hypothetical protein
MNFYSVDFTPNELNFLRQALDLVTVKGTDAKFLAGLQEKLESELAQIKAMIEQERIQKEEGLKQAIAEEEQN